MELIPYMLKEIGDSGVLEQGLPPATLVKRTEQLLAGYESFSAKGAVPDIAEACLHTYAPFTANLGTSLLQRMWFFDRITVEDPFARLTDLDRCFGPMELPPGFAVDSGKLDPWRRLQHAKLVRRTARTLIESSVVLESESVTMAVGPPPTTLVTSPIAEQILRVVGIRAGFEQSLSLEVATLPCGDSFWTFVRGQGHASGSILARRHEPLSAGATAQMRLPAEEQWVALDEGRPLLAVEGDAVADIVERLVHEDAEDLLRLGAASVVQGAALCTIKEHLHDALVLAFGDSSERRAERGFRLALPFIEGVPPEYLVEQRARDPHSLRAFRSHLLATIQQAGDAGDSAVVGGLRREIEDIDAEMSALKVEAQRKNWGQLALVAGGELALYLLGVEVLAGAAAGGALALNAIRETAARAAKRRKIASNPAFFLWKAGRGRPPGNST